MKHTVYVYGTLRPGGNGLTLLPGKLYDLGWFPGARLSATMEDDSPMIVCERIEVDDEGLARLDSFEGFNVDNPALSLFVRRPILDGWIYEYNTEMPDDQRRVLSGNWLTHKKMTSGAVSERFNLKPAPSEPDNGASGASVRAEESVL